MNSKTTKRSLTASILSVFLCLLLLIGATFAWFTDSVTSGNNRIVAGNLAIDLVHVGAGVNGEDISIKDNPDHQIFDYDRWEPGYTAVETLRIENLGNLAFSFRLDAVNPGETTGPDGEKLADVIDVYIFEGTDPRGTSSFADMTAANGWRNAGSLTELMADADGMAHGILLPEGTSGANNEPAGAVQMTLALHMRESADNGYQGLSLGNLGFTLSATQAQYESDSFGSDYDRDAWLGNTDTSWYSDDQASFTLTTPAQLAGLSKLVKEGENFAGKTVTLGKNIDLNNMPWTPVGNNTVESENFAGTFDGGGYTISNLSVNTVNVTEWSAYGYKNTYNYAGLFGAVGQGATVKDLVLENCRVSVSDDGNLRRGDVYAGIAAGVNFGTISNVIVNNSAVNAEAWLICSAGSIAGSNVGEITECSAQNTQVCALSEGWTANAGGITGASGDRLYWDTDAFVSGSQAGGCVISAEVTGAATTDDIDFPSGTTYFGRVYCGGIGGLAVNTTAAGNTADNNSLETHSYAAEDHVHFKGDQWGYGA